jgi:hypothetical protein
MRMAKNATNVRYGGQETGVNQQIAQSQQLGRDQAGWYQQYLDALKGYQTDTQNRAAATNAAVAGLSNSIRGLDQTDLSAQQQQMNADAAHRGATVDPRLAQDASNASVVRQALQGGSVPSSPSRASQPATRPRTSRRSSAPASGCRPRHRTCVSRAHSASS